MIATIAPKGWDEVALDLSKKSDQFREDVEKGVQRVSEGEVQHFKDQQLSGRDGSDMGLNRRTSNLYNSFSAETYSPNLDEILGLVNNDGADYWELHQTGTSKLKKRLTLEEHFAEDGLQNYTDMVEAALEKVAA
jgi:hypothetical protein